MVEDIREIDGKWYLLLEVDPEEIKGQATERIAQIEKMKAELEAERLELEARKSRLPSIK